MLYKLLRDDVWKRRASYVPWAPVDDLDGFVHLSTRTQIHETARQHFSGLDSVWLLDIAASELTPGSLRWEPSRGGVLFPHVYGDIPLGAVRRAERLPRGAQGELLFPPDLLPLSEC